jgi:NAD(P)-dependent dehydrogenase (short-subunit alcohol dehydrogenase family)
VTVLSEHQAEGVAVVTGGTRGIGAAIADALRADGWTVVAIGRTSGDVQADVGDPESVARAVEEIHQKFGKVLVLVNNAGITRDGLALRMSDRDWGDVVDTNLSGAFTFTRGVMGDMLRARWGRIVNVSSIVATRTQAGQANYIASKAGLLGLTGALAKEIGKRGVTVNAIAPGFIATDMTAELDSDKLVEFIPAGRVGTPEEVAAAARFLCSADAGYINGATLSVDGGMGA